MALVRNISTGDRGAYFEGVLIMAAAGEIIEADDFADEWFEEVEGDVSDDLAKLSVAKLKDLAEAEGIDLGDATKKADIISAIELAREASQN